VLCFAELQGLLLPCCDSSFSFDGVCSMRSVLMLSMLTMLVLSTVGCGGGSEDLSTSNNGVAPTPPAELPKAPSKPTGGAVK
jgi:hypothetical protein